MDINRMNEAMRAGKNQNMMHMDDAPILMVGQIIESTDENGKDKETIVSFGVDPKIVSEPEIFDAIEKMITGQKRINNILSEAVTLFNGFKLPVSELKAGTKVYIDVHLFAAMLSILDRMNKTFKIFVNYNSTEISGGRNDG